MTRTSDAPPPVVAKALGYTQATTTYVNTEVGAPWSRYAPGDHSRRPLRPLGHEEAEVI